MLQFDTIVDAVHGLSHEEKVTLRLLLDQELASPNTPVITKQSVPADSDANRAKRIIGLFADEPELMDQVMEAVYERRSRPLRLDP